MGDPGKDHEATDAAPEKPLDETTPPMDLQQKSLEPSDVEPLVEATSGIHESSGDPKRRRP